MYYCYCSVTQAYFHAPVDPQRSKQLVSEWKQKSVEMRSLSLRDDDEQDGTVEEVDDETEAKSKEETDMGLASSSLYPSMQASRGAAASQPGASRVSMPPRPGAPQLVHIPEEATRPPPVSPKSATTRAKWLSMTEKGLPVPAATPEPPRLLNQPRIVPIVAMAKQQAGQVTAVSTPKSSETGSSCATSSTGSESPYYREGTSIVTVDAHAPHHPVVRLSSNNTWDWRSSTNGSTETHETSRTLPRQEYRPLKLDGDSSPGPLPPPPHPDLLLDSHSHRKSSFSAKDWEPGQPHPEPDHFFKNLQTDRRYKEGGL